MSITTQYRTHHLGPQDDPCPGCGAEWRTVSLPGGGTSGTRKHTDACSFMAWIDLHDPLPLDDAWQDADGWHIGDDRSFTVEPFDDQYADAMQCDRCGYTGDPVMFARGGDEARDPLEYQPGSLLCDACLAALSHPTVILVRGDADWHVGHQMEMEVEAGGPEYAVAPNGHGGFVLVGYVA